jgi:hypothetical protein
MWYGWEVIDVDRLRKEYKGTDFEGFVRRLVEAERERLCLTGELAGPSEGKDGGIDVLFAQTGTLGTPGSTDLLSGKKRTMFSCKSNEDWESAVADAVAGIDTATTKATTKIGGTPDKRSTHNKASWRVGPLMKESGTFVLITTAGARAKQQSASPTAHEADAKQGARRKIAAAIEKRFAMDVRQIAVEDCIKIIDGHDLVGYLKQVRPPLNESDAVKLGLRRFHNALTIAEWRTVTTKERGAPERKDDQKRTTLIETIVHELDRNDRDKHLCILGPPGIGKTTLVLEACNRWADTEGKQSRLVFARSAREGEEFMADLIGAMPSVVLVIDDVRADRGASELAKRFETQRGRHDTKSALLILICPAGEVEQDIRAYANVWTVERLGEAECKGLIRHELGDAAEETKVDSIHAATKGFPWFAILVARDVKQSNQGVAHTTDAAFRAIAETELGDRKRYDRVRALLACLLLGQWKRSGDEQRQEICKALDLGDRTALTVLRGELIARQVLREEPEDYASPSLLEAEAWNILGKHEDPSDPSGGRRRVLARVRTNAPSVSERLTERVGTYDWSRDELRALATMALADVRGARPDPLDALRGSHRWWISLAVRHLPEDTIAWIADSIEAAPRGEELYRGPEVDRLEDLLRLAARVGAPFDSLERAAFALAARVGARRPGVLQLWAALVDPVIALVSGTPNQRLEALERRCASGTEADRQLAIEHIPTLLSRGKSRAFLPREQAYAPAQTQHATKRVWDLLLRCAVGSSLAVATTARSQLLFVLDRSAHIELPEHLDELALKLAVQSMNEAQRSALRAMIAVEDSESWKISAARTALFARLDEWTQPHTYRERLRAHLARVDIGLGRAMLARDDLHGPLAREGLSGALPLLDNLDVFVAVSGGHHAAFVRRAAHFDDNHALLDACERYSPPLRANLALSRLAAGHRDAGREDLVSKTVARWIEHDALRDAAVFFAGRSAAAREDWLDEEDCAAVFAPTSQLTDSTTQRDEAFRQLLFALRAGVVSSVALAHIGNEHWPGLDDQSHAALLEVLVHCHGDAGATAALLSCTRRLQDGRGVDPSLALRALQTVRERGLASGDQWPFEMVAERLFQLGLVDEVFDELIAALGAERLGFADPTRLISTLAHTEPSRAWNHLSKALDQPSPESGRLLLRLKFSTIGSTFAAHSVAAWIERSERRGRAIASLLNFDDPTAIEIAEVLLERFGPSSSVASELSASLLTITARKLDSIENVYRARLDALRKRREQATGTALGLWLESAERWMEDEIAREAAQQAAPRKVGT